MFLVFSKDGCKYCTMAIELLTDLKKDFHVIKLLNVAELNDALAVRDLAVKTFPQVFLGDKHIGGYTDLQEYITKEDGKFEIDEDCF
ncbi:glutaredoxin [Acanthocystis turfacea Chlorella virus MN0810.1]|nr:glutaredoxin [Acanthocystis turfacea Chlorella virus MN0810.1]